MNRRVTRGARLAIVVPCIAASLTVAGGPAFATGTAATATTTLATAGTKRFCSESTALVKDLLAFGKLPKTTASISKALTKVNRELTQLALDAPNRADRSTIITMQAEFARLRTIVVTDPAGTKAADRSFVAGFGKASVKQGLALGGEIKTACH